MSENQTYITIAVVVVFVYNLFVRSTIAGMIQTCLKQMSEITTRSIDAVNSQHNESIKVLRGIASDTGVTMSQLVDMIDRLGAKLLREVKRNRIAIARERRRKRKGPGEQSPGPDEEDSAG